MKKSIKKIINFKELLMIVIGTFLVSFSFSVFFIPNGIAPGGVSGFATLINATLALPVGLTIIVLNIPLFIGGWKKNGFRFMLLSIISTILLSAFIELIHLSDAWISVVTQDVLLSTIFGGAIMGLGLGLVIKKGATTGGTDLLAKIINDKFPNFRIAWVLFAIDFIVVASAVIFLSPLTGLYSLVALYIGSTVLDFVQTGIDSAKAFMVISEQSDAISKQIIKDLERGATLLSGKGAYTNSQKNIVLCVVHRTQIAKLRSIVKSIDETAFIIMYDVKEVDGEGFTRY